MAYADFPASSWFGNTLHDCLTTTADHLVTTDTFKAYLWTTDFVNPYNSETWDSDDSVGDIVAGTGLWDTANGGSAGAEITLTGVTFTAADGVLKFACTNVNLEWSGLNETVAGISIHNTTADVGVCVINFGEAKVVSGTLTVSKDTTYDIASLIF